MLLVSKTPMHDRACSLPAPVLPFLSPNFTLKSRCSTGGKIEQVVIWYLVVKCYHLRNAAKSMPFQCLSSLLAFGQAQRLQVEVDWSLKNVCSLVSAVLGENVASTCMTGKREEDSPYRFSWKKVKTVLYPLSYSFRHSLSFRSPLADMKPCS